MDSSENTRLMFASPVRSMLDLNAAVIIVITVDVVWRSKNQVEKKKSRSLRDLKLGKMKIVIGFYQVRFGVPEGLAFIKWPQSLALIGKYFKMLRLNTVQIAPIHCLFSNLKVGAFGRLYTILRINAGTIILGFTFYGARKV
ncbi:hypothetical protein P5673_029066 [Acropora cervicornis]|uniref:Uncharacterized protein n=1 Tax=Acropora cervicornis TaxID=6130 RepID=A0AAD9PWI0_ACRCE|nr:hypothetical protein P5673_029066 [Acropora cervicornis]